MPAAPNEYCPRNCTWRGAKCKTDAYSVTRACATSFQAIANVAESMLAGHVSVGIAGGADSSSVLPIGVSKKLADVLLEFK